MKLYELEKQAKIYADCSDGSKYIIFDCIDGAYSHCTTENGGVIHLSASTELRKKDDGYEIGIPEETVENQTNKGE